MLPSYVRLFPWLSRLALPLLTFLLRFFCCRDPSAVSLLLFSFLFVVVHLSSPLGSAPLLLTVALRRSLFVARRLSSSLFIAPSSCIVALRRFLFLFVVACPSSSLCPLSLCFLSFSCLFISLRPLSHSLLPVFPSAFLILSSSVSPTCLSPSSQVTSSGFLLFFSYRPPCLLLSSSFSLPSLRSSSRFLSLRRVFESWLCLRPVCVVSYSRAGQPGNPFFGRVGGPAGRPILVSSLCPLCFLFELKSNYSQKLRAVEVSEFRQGTTITTTNDV